MDKLIILTQLNTMSCTKYLLTEIHSNPMNITKLYFTKWSSILTNHGTFQSIKDKTSRCYGRVDVVA